MKTLRYASFLLVLLSSTAATPPQPTLPAPPRGARPQASTRQWVARYHYFTDTKIPALLAWLRDWRPFTRPAPGLLPDQPQSAPATAWAAAPK